MVTFAPKSTHSPFATNPSVANTQAKQQLANDASSFQACPLDQVDQVTSASALSGMEGTSSPPVQFNNPPADHPGYALKRNKISVSGSTKRLHYDTSNLEYGEEYGTPASESSHLSFLTTALDCFFDGILVIHPNGQILKANGQANCLFANKVPKTLHPQPSIMKSYLGETVVSHSLQPLLDEMWRVAIAMISSQTEYPNRDIILDSEVAWNGKAFRIRVQWMDLVIQHQPCLLVIIEDLQQTVINQVNVDQWRYNLTPREVEVWRLKRQGFTYKAIAKTLYVSENTVKKHLKNIQIKRLEIDETDV